MNLKRSLDALSLATGTLLAASLGVLLPAAAADGPCSQQGKEVVCTYSSSAGLRSTTIPGGAKGVKVKVEAWGGEGGGSEKEKEGLELAGGSRRLRDQHLRGRRERQRHHLPRDRPLRLVGLVEQVPQPRGRRRLDDRHQRLAAERHRRRARDRRRWRRQRRRGLRRRRRHQRPRSERPLNYFGEGNGGKGGAGGKGGGGGRPGGSGLGGPGGVACSWQTAACYPPWAVDLGGSGGDTTYAVGVGFTVGGGGGGWGGGGSGFDWGFPGAGGGGGSYPASGVFGQPRYGNGSVQITYAWPFALNSPASRRARCSVRGTSGPDVLVGTAGDVVCGAGGNDEITIHGGGAVVYGGAGDDRIVLGGGDDVAYGGRGDDRLRGANGSDTLVGEGGHDQLRGDAGSDTCLDFDRGTVLRSCEQDLDG